MLRRPKPAGLAHLSIFALSSAMAIVLAGCSNQDPGQPAVGSITVDDSKGKPALEKKGTTPKSPTSSKH